MNRINNLKLDNAEINSSAQTIKYKIFGEENAVFNLHIKDNSSPNKFYNFITKEFTNTFSSQNSLLATIRGKSYNGQVKIPASANGNRYRFIIIANAHFNTILKPNKPEIAIIEDLVQNEGVDVRFSTSTDQDTSKFNGIGTFTNSTSGSANETANTSINVSSYTINDTSTPALGYKFNFDYRARVYNFLDSSLAPVDSDFFTKVTTQTNGSGTNSSSMTLDSVSNLVVDMSLVDIADSSDEEQSGTLGVLTYPTITAIDVDSKTITLSAAVSFGDDKQVVFRAYGSDLITQSTGGVFEFSNFNVFPTSPSGARSQVNYGKAITSNSVSNSNSIPVDNIAGLTVGGRVYGSKIDESGNTITAIHSDGSPITLSGNQTLDDNTGLIIFGAAITAEIDGTITIKTFPTLDTDIFLDIDRAFVLSTIT